MSIIKYTILKYLSIKKGKNCINSKKGTFYNANQNNAYAFSI